jgi:tetratricopeptide (TPR) repeat protein
MTFKNKKKKRKSSLLGGLGMKQEMLLTVEELIEEEKFFAALGFLEDAVQTYPSEFRFWRLLALVGQELDDIGVIQRAFDQMIKLRPSDPDAWLGLAASYLGDGWFALATSGLREFLTRFPEHEGAAESAELLETLEPVEQLKFAQWGFPAADEGLELACMHERAQVLMYRGELDAARQTAETLISRIPEFVPAYNNLSLILFLGGEPEKAADAARAALVTRPENSHALANLVRFLFFLGRQDEAKTFADRLRKLEIIDPDTWTKKIEAFSFACDDQAVVETYELARKRRALDEIDSLCKHLAAFAYYRLGEEKKAKKLWREVVKEDPYLDFAEENLEELTVPEYERDVYGLPLREWIPPQYLNALVEGTERLRGKKLDAKMRERARRFLEKYPNMLRLMSVLLERSDWESKEFVITFLNWAGTPESYDVLRDFALGQDGSDEIRYKAATVLVDAGAISRKVRFWQNGEWREVALLSFNITNEPVKDYPLKAKAEPLLRKGIEAMRDRKPDLAEQYFKMALANNGKDHPTILYNLLTVEEARGNFAQAERKLREIIDRFPDYRPAVIALARLELKNGRLDEAKELAATLTDKEKWHIGEIIPWLLLNVYLAVEQKQFDSARASLAALRRFDEIHDYEDLARMIMSRELLEKRSGGRSKSAGRPETEL